MNITIRPETSEDIQSIGQVTALAFAGKPYSDQTEPLIIERLRKAGALSLSLVAESNSQVVGHAGFSVVHINGMDLGWFGLGPISVLPELQKHGIGSKLIETGLSMLREMGAKGCVLEGNPGYYHRFGFRARPGLTYAGSPALEYFMALPFYEETPTGQVEFHKAFYSSE